MCKHPALVAALEETIALTGHSPFRYADLFAGYARNPLAKGKEWARGIGLVAGAPLLAANPHVSLWANCAGLTKTPTTDGFYPGYPGSACFAKCVGDRLAKSVELWLWEVAPAPYDDLKVSFPHAHIFDTAAQPGDPAIQNADFVFIDPPDKTCWGTISKIVQSLCPRRAVLIWLPLCANTTTTPPTEDQQSIKCRNEALELGMCASVVRWSTGGRTIGCQLLYRLDASARLALIDAVEAVVLAARRQQTKSRNWGYPVIHHEPCSREAA